MTINSLNENNISIFQRNNLNVYKQSFKNTESNYVLFYKYKSNFFNNAKKNALFPFKFTLSKIDTIKNFKKYNKLEKIAIIKKSTQKEHFQIRNQLDNRINYSTININNMKKAKNNKNKVIKINEKIYKIKIAIKLIIIKIKILNPI